MDSLLRVKTGLAEMLKGGVIMDVTNAEQAAIAEKAGAVAVMALERVPADIRREGGVARMAPPSKIREIQDRVSIPVMANCGMGHFAEAQVLQALEVDFVDESEVLTPADDAHHVDKWAFQVPFVCGARDLGEALRRIAEGAALIRTKGEAGSGNVVEAVRHLRAMVTQMRRGTRGAGRSRQMDPRPQPRGRIPEATGAELRRRRRRDPGGCRAPHAARRRDRVRGLGRLQVDRSRQARPRHRACSAALQGPARGAARERRPG
jgi:hypothetical protein